MATASGLSRDQRIRCRDRVVQAAKVGLANKADVHYTEDGRRWRGITHHRDASHGQFPDYSDCSSFATWCLWNGLALNTRQTYNTAIKSYETFYKTHGKEPFPA